MQVFRKYLNEKLSNAEYNKKFHDSCSICPTTVRIVTTISQSPDSLNDIASVCDIQQQIIKDLETAEKCCVASVQKLCDYLRIPRPVDCLQLNRTDKLK